MLFTVNCCGQFGGKLVLEEWTVSNHTEQAFNNYLSTSERTIIYFIKMKYKNSLSLALCAYQWKRDFRSSCLHLILYFLVHAFH